jgi:hypothetical protein
MERNPSGEGSAPPRTRGRFDLARVLAALRPPSAVVSMVALAAVVLSSVVLLREFMPDLLWDGPFPSDALVAVTDPVMQYGPRGWVRLHEVGLLVGVVATIVWALLTVRSVRRTPATRSAPTMLGAAIGVLAVVVAAMTWRLVRWDQLAFWQVMAAPFASDRVGLWAPAVDDHVRFLLIGGSEVEPSTYLRRLVVHVGAPLVAAAAVLVTTRLTRPTTPAHPAEAASPS